MKDAFLFYTVYNARLSVLISHLPIPKRWKLRFVVWQFTGTTRILINKLRADRTGG